MRMGQDATWAAVIGDPIEHSLSPVLHQRAYELLGLPWKYRKIKVDSAQLPQFIQDLPSSCVGLSVTMPNKKALLAQADTAESLAKTLGVANTLVISAGMRAAFNTDVHGITSAIEDTSATFLEGALPDGVPVIFGNGATAISALAALGTLGYKETFIVARRLAGAGSAFQVANKLGIDAQGVALHLNASVQAALQRAPLIVSTIPATPLGHAVSGVRLRSDAIGLDVTYSSDESPLSSALAASGGASADPLAMLTYQGLAQVKLMTSKEVPFTPVYEAVLEAAQR